MFELRKFGESSLPTTETKGNALHRDQRLLGAHSNVCIATGATDVVQDLGGNPSLLQIHRRQVDRSSDRFQ